MTPKSDFLLIRDRAITPKGSMNTANIGKTLLFLSKIVKKKQVLVYGVLESTNDLRRVYVRYIHSKRTYEISKIY